MNVPILGMMLEVMDKEPGVPGMWASVLVLGVGGFFACRRWPWVALPIVALVALSTWGLHGEITDPHVGPAILREAGASYPAHAYGTAAFTVLLALLGAASGLVARRSSRASAAALDG